MKNPPWRKFLRGASIQRDLEEIRDLFVRYVKEETVQPLKDLGRFVALRHARQPLRGLRLTSLLLFGALRFLQEQFQVLDGSLSWIPYLIVVVLAALSWPSPLWRIVSGTAKRRLKAPK